MLSTSRTRQTGQTLVFAALFLALAGVPLMALQTDVSVSAAANDTANTAAVQGVTAATAAANLLAIQGPLTSSSQLKVDEKAAKKKCIDTIAAVDPGADITCTVDKGTVTAVVVKHIDLPIPTPFGWLSTVRGEWSAQTTLGTVTPY